MFFFFFKQKTAYEMRISDWSSDVCSSDLRALQTTDDHATNHCRFTKANLRFGRVDIDVDLGRRKIDKQRHHGMSVPSQKIGRASCRERVCQYGEISVVAVSLKKKKNNKESVTDKHNEHTYAEYNIT